MSNKTSCLLATDGWLHVYNRGVDRGSIFFKARDYEYFLKIMAESLAGVNLNLMLHCLLPNHFHFVVQQAKSHAVSQYMKRVCETYAKFINGSRLRSGHLFQGRYKVKHVEEPGSLLRLSHYIHFNPVAAGLVSSVFDWKYSSLQAYLRPEPPGFVTVDTILRLVGGTDTYLRFLREYDPREPESVWQFILRQSKSVM